MMPIIESCTKDSIGSGKGWIFGKATSHDNNQLIAHYLAYRVTQEDAPFKLKLHMVYLMNDVLHHCVRKNAEVTEKSPNCLLSADLTCLIYPQELKQSFESVAVEMFCSASTSASEEQVKYRNSLATKVYPCLMLAMYCQKPKLDKLIRLWEDKKIFSSSTLNKMRRTEESWQSYK